MERSKLRLELLRTPSPARRTVGDEEVFVPGRLTDDISLSESSEMPTVVKCESRNPEDALIHARL